MALVAAAGRFAEHARWFFYEVMLSTYACPCCDGPLVMIGEGRCRCSRCGHTIDPTVSFHRCNDCGGEPVLRVRRYMCRRCHTDVQSRFLFDGLVFDTDYFRQKMAEHREHKRKQRERVKQMLAESRSGVIEAGPSDLDAVPDLLAALNALTDCTNTEVPWTRPPRFDLRRYQAHLCGHVGNEPVMFDDLPHLEDDRRLDRIWRFVAIIFLDHSGVLDVRQHEQTIMVVKRETDRER